MNQQKLDNAVYFITIFWVGLFVVGFLAFDIDALCLDETGLPENIVSAFEPYCVKDPLIQIPEEIQPFWQTLSWIIWIIFLIDVGFKRKNSENWKQFFRNHWLDVILLIPFFRIFRVARLLRLLKVLKFVKVGIGGFKLFRKSKGLKKKFDSKE